MALLVALLSAVLLELGARLEHQDLTPEQASPTEKTRQNLAIQATRIADSSSLSSSTHENLEANAHTWAQQLGGVWIPWPQGAPEGYSNPTLDTSAYSSLAELDSALWDFYAEAVRFTPSERTSRTSSTIAFEAASYAILIDAELGKETDCGSFDLPALSAAFQASPDSLGSLDTARQWLEYHYARSDASLNAAYEQSIATLDSAINAALEAGTPDTRPLVAAPPNDQQSVHTQIKQTFSDLVTANRGNNDRIAAIQSFGCTIILQTPRD